MKRNEQSLRNVWNNIKSPNLCNGVLQRKEWEKETGRKNILRIAKNFPNLMRNVNPQIQEI